MQEKKGGKGVAKRTPAIPPELRLMLPQSWQWTRRGQPSLCCITAGGSSMFLECTYDDDPLLCGFDTTLA